MSKSPAGEGLARLLCPSARKGGETECFPLINSILEEEEDLFCYHYSYDYYDYYYYYH
jgi:hypothetical protein